MARNWGHPSLEPDARRGSPYSTEGHYCLRGRTIIAILEPRPAGCYVVISNGRVIGDAQSKGHGLLMAIRHYEAPRS